MADTQPGVVTTQAVPAGAILADVSGRTLYTYDADKNGKSACVDACARSWSPLAAAWLAAPPGGDWSIVTRNDGTRQWAFKGKPLYIFSGDQKPGDMNGDGAPGGWHTVMTEQKFLPPDVAIWHSDFGPAFRTADGHTLYVLAELRFNPLGTKRHTGLNLGLTECTAECLKEWPPLEAPADAKPAGDWTVVARADGIRQWAYKGWPVYRNAQDQKAGDTFGEGVTKVRNGISGLSWEVATLLEGSS
jgi:predicted lipoprotein with Yx(FWY)xxD motif